MPPGGADAAASDPGAAAPKRGRGRPRNGCPAFDHDQALALRASGMTFAAIARELGVHPSSIKNACTKRDAPPIVRRRQPDAARDARWATLEAWIERRHGAGDSPARARARMHHSGPRTAA